MPLLNGCPFKMEKIVQVHIGDVAAGITLQSEGTESIIYGTLMGKKGKKKKRTTFHDERESSREEEDDGRPAHHWLALTLFGTQVESAPSSRLLPAKKWT